MPKAVQQGLLTKAEVDRAVKRLFTARFRLGMFDPPDRVPYAKTPLTGIDSPEHRALALRSARESIVLLKNDKANSAAEASSVKTIAVIGPEADLVESLKGIITARRRIPSRRCWHRAPIREARHDRLRAGIEARQRHAGAGPGDGLRPARAADGASLPGGLTGEYFINANFQGAPALTRTDQAIHFDWAGLDPIPGLKNGKFSVRWTGTFTPPAPGDYRLGVDIHGCYPCKDFDDFRLSLDGKLLVERPTTPQLMIPVRFRDTRAHDIRLEYAHSRGDTNRNLSFGGDVAGITLLWDPPADALRNEAVAAAEKADVMVACVGISPDLESEEHEWMRLGMSIPGFYGGDRTDVALPQPQRELLRALNATGKPVVVVLMSGSAVAVEPGKRARFLLRGIPAKKAARPSRIRSRATTIPPGRLPVTFYKSVADLPPFDDYSMRDRTYRYFTGQPLFPFGFGLSYSQFAYSGMELSSAQLNAGSSLDLDANVQNTGQRDGDEVAEVYITFPKSDSAPDPSPSRIFAGTHRSGGTRHLHFSLMPRDLSEVNEAGERVIAPGEYTISVGGGQPGTGLPIVEAHFTITGSKTLPK